jgi:hypothetical protein
MNADLQSFVRESLGRGFDRATIAARLAEAGWPAEEIQAALGGFAEVDFPIPVPRRRPYLSAREAFLYLVLFATLYTTAINVGAVLFQRIDLWLPDASQPWADPRGAAEGVRGATAGLIIAFPIFLALSAQIGRAVAREPEKRGSKIRKWLTYLTLFVAAMVIIGDLTFLVTRLLSGELATRVLLKVAVVFGIAGTVFSHYLGELRRDEREGASPARVWRLPPRLAAAAVTLVTLMGLLAAGSPRRERVRQLDTRRLEDLTSISGSITVWASGHRRLPVSLDELMASPEPTGTGFHDPVTRTVYEYRVIDSLHYELCATFDAADSLTSRGAGETSRFWRHGAGRKCYALEVPPSTLTDDGRPDPVAPGRP